MRRAEKRSESPYNEVNTMNLTVQGVYNYQVLCRLGGWRHAETVLACYQRPDEEAMRATLNRRTKTLQGV